MLSYDIVYDITLGYISAVTQTSLDLVMKTMVIKRLMGGRLLFICLFAKRTVLGGPRKVMRYCPCSKDIVFIAVRETK